MKDKINCYGIGLCFIVFLVYFLIGCQNNQFREAADNSEAIGSDSISYLEVPNGKIAYRIFGKGEPLIMCMGYGANMDMWDTRFISQLAKFNQIIVFDYRGMGFSSNTDMNFRLETLAEDVKLLCDHLETERVNVLGWSMGGYVAQLFGLNYPDRINKLVLYATDAGGRSVINPEQEVMDILSDSTSSDQQMIGLLFPDHWLENHSESKEYFKQVYEPFNQFTIKLQDEAVNQWLSDNGGASGNLYKLKVPTLIVSGDADQVVLFENSEVLFDSIANSTLIKMKNGGHGLMFQYPNELAGYIDAFLNDKDSF